MPAAASVRRQTAETRKLVGLAAAVGLLIGVVRQAFLRIAFDGHVVTEAEITSPFRRELAASRGTR